jgi:formylmethanofuran dehydrogenase subunit A
MLKIINGEVYDPINGINGEIRDVYVDQGRITAPFTGGRVVDAAGMVVMPGGVDMHCHIAGPKVNAARKMRPEDHRMDPVPKTAVTRSGVGKSVPSTYATGYRYAAMGYTTAFDAAVPPMAARHAHEEFCDMPVIDKAFFVLMGNNEFIMRQIAAGEQEKLRNYVAWLLQATKGYAIKAVNPGGVELWKFRGNAHTIDDEVSGFGVTPRQIIASLAAAGMELNLPHPVHIHCNNLGIAGNWKETLETMKTLDGRRGHLAHVQFHSYGGRPGGLFTSRVQELAEYVNTHPNLTVDIGQVLFGDTTSMTGDGHWLISCIRSAAANGSIWMWSAKRVAGSFPSSTKTRTMSTRRNGQSAWSGFSWCVIHGGLRSPPIIQTVPPLSPIPGSSGC